MNRSGAAIVAVALALAACQRSSAPTPQAQARASFETLSAEGDTRLRQRDWEGAVRAYEAALVWNSESLPVRYGLGVALAQLDRRDEAITAFTWVADHGPADREEARIARQWLIDAGVRKGRTVAEAASESSAAPTGTSLVQGRTEWKDLDPSRPRPTVQILLEGDDFDTRGRRYVAKAALNDPYRIEKVIPGRYRVLAQVGPIRLWETTVSVPDGGPAVLDLTQATAVAAVDSLRPRDH